MLRKKKTILITSIVSGVALAILSATICLIVVSNKKNDIGEIYFHQTELEHIQSNDDGTMYADNEILLVADETAKYKDIERLAKANGAEIVGWIEQTNDYQLQLSKVCNCAELEQVAATLLESDLIDDAYVNYAFAVSDDATHERDGFIYGEKWEDDLQDFNHWEKAENFKSWGIEAVNTLAAWDVLDSHKSKVNPVMVGLFDSRFDTNHEDLGFAETFYNTNPVDNGVIYNNHGTHVAGTMAARANNKEGICGVYPYGDGNLYGVSLNVNSNYIENQVTSMCYKIACAELILRNVKVINVSLGFGYSENPVIEYESPEWYEQVDFMESNAYILGDFLNRLLKKGYDFVIVNSAGNDSDRKNSIVYDSKYNSWNTVIDEKDYPDVFNRIIVVGAMDSDGSICDFSNGGERVDIYAPGEQIYSTMINSQYGNTYEKEGKQYLWSGTSMAAPHVSGVAAIVWSLNNNLTGAQVKEIVCGSHNLQYNSCNVVDAYIAAERAASTIGLSENKNSNNGGILCWVVSAKDAETKIENATVTVTNTQTGEKFSTTTDAYGHFELFVPEGKYTLVVQSEGYADFNWPNEKESHTEPIIVEKNKVNYLVSCINDWIKMREKIEESEAMTLYAKYIVDNGLSLIDSSNFYFSQEVKTGIFSIIFDDFNKDGLDEMVTFSMTDNGASQEQIVIELFCIENGIVVKKQSTEPIFASMAGNGESNICATSDNGLLKIYRNTISLGGNSSGAEYLTYQLQDNKLMLINDFIIGSTGLYGTTTNEEKVSGTKYSGIEEFYEVVKNSGFDTDSHNHDIYVLTEEDSEIIEELKKNHLFVIVNGLEFSAPERYGFILDNSQIKDIWDLIGLPDNKGNDEENRAANTLYQPIIEKYREECEKNHSGYNSIVCCTWFLFDVDNNGVEELIIQDGGGEQSKYHHYYTIKNNKVFELGEYNAWHMGLYEEDGDLFGKVVNPNGPTEIYKISIADDKVEKKFVKTTNDTNFPPYSNPINPMDISYDINDLI